MKRQRKVELLPLILDDLISQSADVYLFFADLAGSTKFKSECQKRSDPDSTWILRQIIFLQRTAEIVKKHNGTVVKTIGDAIFAYFDSSIFPSEILTCSKNVINAFNNLAYYQGRSKIEVKISLDVGLTYNGSITDRVAYDPIGTPVDRCSRILDLATSNKILLSKDFFEALKDSISKEELKNEYKFKLLKKTFPGLGKNVIYELNDP